MISERLWNQIPEQFIGVKIMCRIRCFYEGFDGKLSWAEIVMSYEDDIAGMIKHWSCGGKRMVTNEHIEMV